MGKINVIFFSLLNLRCSSAMDVTRSKPPMAFDYKIGSSEATLLGAMEVVTK